MSHRWGALVVAATLLGAVSCEAQFDMRTAGVFCRTIELEEERIEQRQQEAMAQLEESAGDLDGSGAGELALLVESFVLMSDSVNDVENFFWTLDAVAPPEIADDVHTVAELNSENIDNIDDTFSDPLGTIAGNIFRGARMAMPMQRIETYIEQNCGQGVST